MSRLPALTARDVIAKLRRAGFAFDRHAKGSHEIWLHPMTRRRVVIPNHVGKTIHRGTLQSILRDAGLSVDEFLRL